MNFWEFLLIVLLAGAIAYGIYRVVRYLRSGSTKAAAGVKLASHAAHVTDTSYIEIMAQLKSVDREVESISNRIEEWEDAIRNTDDASLQQQYAVQIHGLDAQLVQLIPVRDDLKAQVEELSELSSERRAQLDRYERDARIVQTKERAYGRLRRVMDAQRKIEDYVGSGEDLMQDAMRTADGERDRVEAMRALREQRTPPKPPTSQADVQAIIDRVRGKSDESPSS